MDQLTKTFISHFHEGNDDNEVFCPFLFEWFSDNGTWGAEAKKKKEGISVSQIEI